MKRKMKGQGRENKNILITCTNIIAKSHTWTQNEATAMELNLRNVNVGHGALYGLVVRVSGFRSRGPGSILGATGFPVK
jgi:hypothetical protein